MNLSDPETMPSDRIRRAERLVRGALIEAEFTDNADLEDWRLWSQDAGVDIGIGPSHGLRISGVSEMHPEVLRFTSLVSRTIPTTDVVLLCDVKVASAMSRNELSHWTHVHLCNTMPDFFCEVLFGKEEMGKLQWRGGYTDASGYHSTPRTSPAFGDEHKRFHTVRIDHDELSGLTRAYVYSATGARSLGIARVPMNCCKVELKASAGGNGVTHDSRFRNCRLYPHPGRVPLRAMVSFLHPWPGAPLRGVQVEVSSLDGTAFASSVTDSDGVAKLHLEESRLYPTPATFRLRIESDSIGIVRTEALGVNGIYPGDVWSFGIENPQTSAEPLYIREALEYGKRHGFISSWRLTKDRPGQVQSHNH